MSNKPTATSVATINNTNILVIENGEKRVAIKPICEALGVSHQTQIDRLKSHPIMGSTVSLTLTVGADGKAREMQTILYKYVFGWLMMIDSRNVKQEVRESLERYQDECYNALYEHFTEMDEYLRYRSRLVEKEYEELEQIRDEFKAAKARLDEKKKSVLEAKAITLTDFRAQKAQLQMQFPEDEAPEVN